MPKAGWLVAAAVAATACSGDRTGNGADANTSAAAPDDSLAKAIGNAGDLASAARLMKAAGLDRTLDGAGVYTLFMPVDSAVAAIPEAERKGFETAAGRPRLVALLRAHIATGYALRADLDRALATGKGSARLARVSGQPLLVRANGDALLIGEGAGAARIVGDPIPARNGVIYRIDRVIPRLTG